MMEKLKGIFEKHREVITYLIFGGLTTAVNVGLFMALSEWTQMETGTANAIALAASILFAYVTNRKWVFESKKHGVEALKEFGAFIGCRIASGVIDEIIVVLGVDVLGKVLNGGSLWALAVKIFANVIVIVVNYVFSKLIVFRKK